MTRKQTALYVARLGLTLFLITALVAAALAAVNHIIETATTPLTQAYI